MPEKAEVTAPITSLRQFVGEGPGACDSSQVAFFLEVPDFSTLVDCKSEFSGFDESARIGRAGVRYPAKRSTGPLMFAGSDRKIGSSFNVVL